MRWLLDLETLELGGDGVRFGFDIQAPGWVWALVVALAVVIGWWSYRKLIGGRAVRIGLGAVRAAMVVALVVLFLRSTFPKRTLPVFSARRIPLPPLSTISAFSRLIRPDVVFLIITTRSEVLLIVPRNCTSLVPPLT